MKESEISYLAGLFDGEGSIYFARRPEKKKKHNGKGYRTSISQRISMEITMTDPMVINCVRETFKVGTVVKKPRKGKRKDGTPYLMQYKWRCTFRDAFYICCLICWGVWGAGPLGAHGGTLVPIFPPYFLNNFSK